MLENFFVKKIFFVSDPRTKNCVSRTQFSSEVTKIFVPESILKRCHFGVSKNVVFATF